MRLPRGCAATLVASLLVASLPLAPVPLAAQTATAPAPAMQPPAAAPAPAAPKAEAAKPVAKPPVSEAIKTIRARLDSEKADLDQREAALTRRDLASQDLQRVRDGLDPIQARIRALVEGLGPRLDAARTRLEQLGPKPKEGEEGADVAKERAEREAAVSETDETQRLARALLVQADQIGDEVSNRRRAVFTRALFERNAGLVSPDLWVRVAQDLPRDLSALSVVLSDALMRAGRVASFGALGLLAAALGGALALYFGRRNIAPRLGRRIDATAPDRRTKLTAAWRVLLIGTVPAVVGSYVMYWALDATNMLSGRLVPVAGSILVGLAFVAFVEALVDALLSPNKPTWRVIPVDDAAAGRLVKLAVGLAVVVSIGRMIESLNGAIAAALPVSIVTRGLFALATAVILAVGLHRFAETADHEEACLGPYVPTDGRSTAGGPLRILGWAAVGVIGLASILGYVAFASFLVDQIVWLATLVAMLALTIMSIDAFVGGTLRDESRLSTTLQANTGLRRRSINQIAVLATGGGRVVAFLLAALLALAPWGVDSSDVFSSVRAAFFGFKVGDITISLSTIAFALTIFALGLAATRAVQRWLENTYLPATDLDAGLRNSIATISGYVGFLAALAVASSYLGLSLERLTLVAGALSVGIGFGLQSIVNNFVSGLLLLWERPIRVGDLVVIGDSEGYVRRISVRSTEIQTFDRSVTIVPNSNLISGVVKNRVRGDRYGRVSITVNVQRNQDPVTAADLILHCAGAHPDVAKEPPPRVAFRKIGDPNLEFELIAIITDVSRQLQVTSDLNFAVFAALTGRGLIPPMGGTPQSIVTVQGLEAMQEAMGRLAAGAGPLPTPAGTPISGTDHAAAARDGGRGGDGEADRPRRRSGQKVAT